MKRFLVGLCMVLIAGTAFAGVDTYPEGKDKFVVQELELSANAAAVALDNAFIGTYIFQVEKLSSADTSVAFSIASSFGSTLISIASGDYTSATEPSMANDRYAIVGGPPTYTISGLGSGTFTVRITAVVK